MKLAYRETAFTFQSFGKEDGNVFTIKCPRDCMFFDWLINRNVSIDGTLYRVTSVVRYEIIQHKKGDLIKIEVDDPLRVRVDY